MGDWLKGKVAVVTGSGQGIGRAIALGFAAEGALVVTNNREPRASGGDAASVAGEITAAGGRAIPFFGDVAKFDIAGRLVQRAVDKFDRIDILVNNAALRPTAPLWEMSEADWDLCLNTSLKGAFNCMRHAVVFMRQQKWGRILSATSGAWNGTMGACGYGAAKAGIVGLTRSVARDVGSLGITCNAFAPRAGTRLTFDEVSRARWDLQLKLGIRTQAEYDERWAKPLPPEGVPPLLIYLCTDKAADINGQVFRIKANKLSIYSDSREENVMQKDSMWTIGELVDAVPGTLLKGHKNPVSAKEE